jgi:NADH-quinone oxidoreductase subunit H
MMTPLFTVLIGALLGPTTGLLLFSVLTLFLERKLIGIAQKRLGISFLGRNGWAHLPADLFKFWLKQTTRHHGSWSGAVGGSLAAVLAYLSWSLMSCLFFLSDAGGALVDFWDFQLLAYFAYANLSSICMYALVAGSKSKYATLAAARILLVTVSLEVLFAVGFLFLCMHAGGYAFEDFMSSTMHINNTIAALPPLGCVFLLYILFEAKRAPFDHSEAEAELVAGHMVEFGGRTLLFFFMCEYVHLCFALFLALVLVGGWGAAPGWAGVQPYWADMVVDLVLALSP